jgi:hypothetical protein
MLNISGEVSSRLGSGGKKLEVGPMPRTMVAMTNGRNIKGIFEMSADDVFWWANWILVGALLIGVAATYAIVVSGNLRDAALKGNLAGAQTAAAEANARAKEADEKTEAERLERLRLEAAVAPRSLSVQQQQMLAAAWGKLAGKRVAVISYALDGEGAGLASQIIAVLTAANVEIDNRLASVMPMGGFSLGVHVTGSDEQTVNQLRTTLGLIGELAVAAPNSSQGGGASMSTVPGGVGSPVDAEILVGIKPVPTIK